MIRMGLTAEKAARLLAAVLCLMLLPAFCATAFAEIKIIEADSAAMIGDKRIDARRIAVLEAKRKALELAGVFIGSMGAVQNYRLTREEINAYTAGIVETEITAEEMRGTVQRPEIYVKVRSRIEADNVALALDHIRQNEELREQLRASSNENANLKKQRDSLLSRLSREKKVSKAEQIRKQLGVILAQEETNQDTDRLLVRLSASLDDEDAGKTQPSDELHKAAAALEQITAINPKNQRARCLLAAVHQRMGNFEIAEKGLRDAIQRNPSTPLPHMKLAILLGMLGKTEEALKEFHFVERLRPRNAPVLFHMGMIYKNRGKCRMAVQYLQRFMKAANSPQLSKKRERADSVIAECGGLRGTHRRQERLR